MKTIFTTVFSFLFLFSLQANDTTYTKVLDFVQCGITKTFTYKIQAECKVDEVILKRWLIKDIGTTSEQTSLKTYFFDIKKDGSYELTVGKTYWAEFAAKVCAEIDSIKHLDSKKQADLFALSQVDSLHSIMNRLPGWEKKRDNLWKAHKVKKDLLEAHTITYREAKVSFEEGELLPSDWDKTEQTYLDLTLEVNYIKAELQRMNELISKNRKILARLKYETGLYQYNSYSEGSY